MNLNEAINVASGIFWYEINKRRKEELKRWIMNEDGVWERRAKCKMKLH